MPTPDFTADPILLVGKHKASGEIEMHRVETDREVADALTEICGVAWAMSEQRHRVPYHPHSDIESDEAFVLQAEEAPTRPIGRKPRKKPDDRPQQSASLWQAVEAAAEHPVVQPRNISAVDPKFYAICIPCDDDSIAGFVRNSSPTRSLSPGSLFLAAFGQGGRDRLSKIEEPSLSLDNQIDVIITTDEILAMSRTALERLLADVGLAQSSVPENLALVQRCLRKVGIDAESLTTIEHACKLGKRASGRLAELAAIESKLLTRVKVEKALKAHGLNHLITTDGLRVATEDVTNLLDCLTGRLYEDVISSESRRAVRYAPRT